MIVDRFQYQSIISKYSIADVASCADEFGLDDLKFWITFHLSQKLTLKTGSEQLDICKLFGIEKDKKKANMNIANWKALRIPEDLIIPLVQSAIQHEIEFLKDKLRDRIFSIQGWGYPTTGGTPEKVNIFLGQHHSEIDEQSDEVRDFIVKATCINVEKPNNL